VTYFVLTGRSHGELSRFKAHSVQITAAVPASEVEAVVRSPANMAAAKIAAVDFNKMTSK